MNKGRGAFIVFEGLDRSGKSTQASRLLSRLAEAGVPCVDGVWRYPDRTTAIGGMINKVISGAGNAPDPHTLHLLFTANRWEKAEQLRSLLESGVTIVADRYSFSGVAYSVAAEGLPLAWCRKAEEGLISPDLVVFLKVDSEEAAQRGGYGDEKYEKQDIQRMVGKVFAEHLVVEPSSGGSWAVLEAGAGKSIEQLSDQVWELVFPTIERARDSALKFLWEGSH